MRYARCLSVPGEWASRLAPSGPRRRLTAAVVNLTILTAWWLPGTANASAVDQEPGAAAVVDPARATRSLDEIEPAAQLPPPATRSPSTSPRAERQIDNARSLLAEDRFTEAIQALERALRYSPDSLSAHVLMARVCLTAGNVPRARQHLEQAVQLDEADAWVHYLLGRAAIADGDWSEALVSLRRVLLCPDAGAVAIPNDYFLACALRRLGYLAAAADRFRAFAEAMNGTPPAVPDATLRREMVSRVRDAILQLSEIHEALGQPLQAAAALDLAITDDLADADLLTRQAELYASAGDDDRAARSALLLIELDLDIGLPLAIDIWKRAGQPRQLIERLSELHHEHPDEYAIIHALSTTLSEVGRRQEAADLLHEFLEGHPQHGPAWVDFCQLLLSDHRWSASLSALAGGIRLLPEPESAVELWIAALDHASQVSPLLLQVADRVQSDEVEAGELYLIGQLAVRADRSELAQQAFEKAAAAAPQFMAPALALGELLLRQYRWQEVIDLGQRLCESHGENFHCYRLQGEAQLGLDRYALAADALNSALRLNRTDVRTMLALCTVYELSGKPLQAKRQYLIVAETDPGNPQALEALFRVAVLEQSPDQIQRYLSALQRREELRAVYERCVATLRLLEDRDVDTYVKTMNHLQDTYPDDPEIPVQIAAAGLNTNRLDLARDKLQAVLLKHPDHAVARELMIRLHLGSLEYQAAIDALRLSLRQHPNRLPWREELVFALFADQRFAEAAATIAGFLDDPHLPAEARPNLQYDLLMALILDRKSDAALDAVQKWVDHHPDDLVLKSLLVDVLALNHRAADAVDRAHQWLMLSKPDHRPHHRRILLSACLRGQRHRDAEMLLLDWLEIDPDAVDVTLLLMESLRRAGRIDQAIEIGISTSLAPRARDALLEPLVSLYAAEQDYDAAVRLIRDRLGEAQRRAPRFDSTPISAPELRQLLCNMLLAAGRYPSAEHELEQWQADPVTLEEQLVIHRLLSLTYQLTGKHSLAAQQLERMLELLPEDPGINNDLGYTWADQGVNLDRAERMIRVAVASNPRSAAYLDSLGWVLYKRQQLPEAYRWLTAADRTPMISWGSWLGSEEWPTGHDDAVIQDHLGDVCWRMGRQDQAVACWQRAQEIAAREVKNGSRTDLEAVLLNSPKKLQAAAEGGEPPVAPTGQ